MVHHQGGSGAYGRLLPLLWFPCSPGIVINALTRSRTPEYHRASMFKLLIIGSLTYTLWGPMQPIRSVTASALHTAADLIAR